MSQLKHIQQIRRIRIACTLLITATVIKLFWFVAWITIGAVGARSTVVDLLPNYFDEIERWAAALCSAAGLLVILSAKIFQSKHQKLALFFLPMLLLMSRTATEGIVWWGNYQNNTGAPKIESSILFWHLPLWVLKTTPHMIAIALLVLILNPTPKLNGWASSFQLQYRLGAVLLLGTYWVRHISFLLSSLFRRTYMDNMFNDTYSMPRYLIEFFRSPFFNYLHYATIAFALLFLIRIYRHAATLAPSPNHCAACAYPLDAHITICPECGHTGTTQQPPLPEG